MTVYPLFLGLPLIAVLILAIIALMLETERVTWLKEHSIAIEIGVLNIEDILRMEESKLNLLRKQIFKHTLLMTISLIPAILVFSVFSGEGIFTLSTYSSLQFVAYIVIQLAITVAYFVIMYSKSVKLKNSLT